MDSKIMPEVIPIWISGKSEKAHEDADGCRL